MSASSLLPFEEPSFPGYSLSKWHIVRSMQYTCMMDVCLRDEVSSEKEEGRSDTTEACNL
jgi:hypothetical protein